MKVTYQGDHWQATARGILRPVVVEGDSVGEVALAAYQAVKAQDLSPEGRAELENRADRAFAREVERGNALLNQSALLNQCRPGLPDLSPGQILAQKG